MSFNSEKANVRAKIASGDFKKQEDPFKPFFSRLADGIVARDAEQRAIDREVKREERAKIKRDQAAQETIDAKKAKEERLVDLYLTQQNRSKTDANRSSVLSIVQDGGVSNIVELTDVMKKYSTYEEGEGFVQVEDLDAREAELNSGVVTEMDSGALGVLMPPRRGDATGPNKFMELNPIMKDGTEKNPGEIKFTGEQSEAIEASDFIAGIQNEADWEDKNNQAQEMKDGPEKTAYLEALNTIKSDFISDPATGDISTFIEGIKSEADWQNKLDMANEMLKNPPGSKQYILGGRYITLLETIKDTYADNNYEVPKFMSDTLTKANITSHRIALDAAIADLKVIPDETITKEQVLRLLQFTNRLTLIDDTETALEAKEDKSTNLNLTDVRATVKVTPILEVDGEDVKQPEVSMYLTQMENGNWFNSNTGVIYGQDEIVDIGFTDDQLDSALDAANKVQGNFNIPLIELRADTTTLSRTALALDNFVKQNESILLISGGPASEIILQIGLEIENVAKMLRGKNLSDTEFKKQLLAQTDIAVAAKAEAAGLSESAALYAQWSALNIKHAFSFAKLDLGSSGQALSNLDYKNAVRINNAGKEYKTYSTNLRKMTANVILAATEKYANIFKSNGVHNVAMQMPAYKASFDKTGLQKLLPEYLDEVIPEVVSWSNDQNFLTDNTEPASTLPVETGIGLDALMNDAVTMDSINAQISMAKTAENSAVVMKGLLRRYARKAYGNQFTDENLATLKAALRLED